MPPAAEADRGSELAPVMTVNDVLMGRKKAIDPEANYTHPVRTRVTKKVYERMEQMIGKSDCHSVGEIARKILSSQQIKTFQVDMSLNVTMEELALLRKELKAIGININQLTKRYHSTRDENSKSFYTMKVYDLYKVVDSKTDELLKIVSKLAERWLQRS